ncbi:MAG TPA: hypothetical protein VM537_35900 [Anaerolineae bacterium]|nr:hypothetical protein [Anaerolineae bacterium]
MSQDMEVRLVAAAFSGRRVRRLGYTPELLGSIGSGTIRVTANELPSDSKVVWAWVEYWGDTARVVWLLIESAEYDPLHGAEIPILEPVCFERMKETEP